jgi:deazaflavin-dependent oxidoreductase (nitroreductase family)
MASQDEYVPSPWDWVREQIETYERTGGQEGGTLRDTGLPVVIVTTRGAASGAIRKTALMRVEHNGEYALVGSMGGAPTDPKWVGNIRAHPDEVSLQDGPERVPVEVREVTGDERAQWWERCVAAFPPYAEYQERTERVIPVFIARPRRA